MTWIPFADGDRSCPPGTSGSWCSADPARTRVTSLEGASGRPIHARYFADGPCSATPSTDRCCPWGDHQGPWLRARGEHGRRGPCWRTEAAMVTS